ncbi:MAG: carbon monoxide dehydrogenase subunit G [Gammaproteobacteria bacterium]|nr:carbon monoxide dehydrogenase subunit G [Gammaproteobacteria bacterium]
MEQSGEYRIPAERATVWRSLNDPAVLARCIDGCQSMEQLADDRFAATVKARVGPVRATFDVALTLTDMRPPESYVLEAEVKGKTAGFGKGTAEVALADADDGATLLSYRVVGGKLAQIGARLIDSAARKMADDFFSAFHQAVGPAADRAPATNPP